MPQGNFGSTSFGSSAGGGDNLTRDDLIELAYRKIGITVTDTLRDRAAVMLNLIIREEDLKGTGPARNLWALYQDALFLYPNGQVYGIDEGLSDGVLDLVSVVHRDSSGNDSEPLKIITAQQYEAISDKNAVGDPSKVYLKQEIYLSTQLLYVWPGASSISSTSEIIGSDDFNYQCGLSHTSSASNYPITGANWRAYWVHKGSAGVAWVDGTAYTNGPLLRYLFKRPLYSFTAAGDNPDMPTGWTRYLLYRLSHDLCAESRIPMDQRQWLETEYLKAYNTIFPSLQPMTNDNYNKVLYF